MARTPAGSLQTTPLHDRHVAQGARMTAFGGWDMPIQYSGIGEEHQAVRTAAGLFDVSHMGEVEIAGDDALAAVQRITSNDARRLEPGRAQYSALTTPEGTVVDDLLVYQLAAGHYLLVINAANIAKDVAWIRTQIGAAGDAVAVNASSRYALIALQGPRSVEILQLLTAVELDGIEYYTFANGEVAGVRATISRTGYTGEDGFELFLPPRQAETVWCALLETGGVRGLLPAGLGARGHAAPRSRTAPVRQRHGRDDDPDRGGPRLDHRLGQGVVHRPRRPARAEAERTGPQAGRLRDARARDCEARPRDLCWRRPRGGGSPAGP